MASLSADERVDHRIAAGLIDAWLLDLETHRHWQKNLMIWMPPPRSRRRAQPDDHGVGPADERARRIIAKLRGVPALLSAARPTSPRRRGSWPNAACGCCAAPPGC
ncbi:MAG: hypothetical protein R2708_26855 [Vicinamibacterales bacterium]